MLPACHCSMLGHTFPGLDGLSVRKDLTIDGFHCDVIKLFKSK